MAARAARTKTLALPDEALLPAEAGHRCRGEAPPQVRDEAIEAFAERVCAILRFSRETGRERGFLAYAPLDPAAPLAAEPDSVGGPHAITWRWRRPHATVAFSFHTHPGRDALCAPSGIDAVGALVRGDHLLYVLTMDGRLSGWRWRDPAASAFAVDEAMLALSKARALKRPFVGFLYDAFDAMRDDLMVPAYAARVEPGGRLLRARRDAAFFGAGERGPRTPDP